MNTRACSLRHYAFTHSIKLHRCSRPFTTSHTLCSRPAPASTTSEVDELLSSPTWSVRSLLPSAADAPNDQMPSITSKQLHHLLRLSALPLPKNEEEESRMLKTLASQLHFVKAIQQIDTTGVEPLRSIHDETSQGEAEHSYNMANMKDALAQEEVVGKYHKRVRRKPHQDADGKTQQAEDWNVLGSADRKVGAFFVVEGAPREE